MTKRTGCAARQTSDQMTCDACGLAWDMNDPAPPACPRVDGGREERERIRMRLRRLRDQIAQPET